MTSRHRIRSLDFDLTFASGGMAMSQGEPLRALVVDQLLPVVASVFDEATGDGTAADIYRIDRLDVDLGKVYAEDLPETLAERLAQALADVLVMRLDEGAAADGATEHGGAGEGVGSVGVGSDAVGSGDYGSVIGQRQSDGADTSVESQAVPRPRVSKFATAAAADTADLIAFLTSGQWVRPGSVPASVQKEPNHALRGDEGSHRDTDAVGADGIDGIEGLLARVLAGDIQIVRQQIRASASPDMLIQRLTKQFPSDSVDALLRALRPSDASGWLRQLDALDRLLTTIGWNTAQRAEAQSAVRARLLTMGLLPPDAGPREMPWHGVWQAVLSIASVRGLVRDESDFVAKVRESARADEARAGAIDATRTGDASQAGSARSPMIDALHRVAEARANGAMSEGDTASSETSSEALNTTPSAMHGQTSGGLPQMPAPTNSASLRPFTHAGLRALLATALMRAQAKALYDVWPRLVANETDTLREALRRYLSVSDLREQIALTFPVSMLEDMLALLLVARPEPTQGLTQGPTQIRRKQADAYVVETHPQNTVPDIGRTWAWRSAWSHDIAATLGVHDTEVIPGTALRDKAQPDAPVPAASFDVRVGADASLSVRHESSTVSTSGDSVPNAASDEPSDQPSDALGSSDAMLRSAGLNVPADERTLNNSLDALPAAAGDRAGRLQASTRGGNRLAAGDPRVDDDLPPVSGSAGTARVMHRSIDDEATSAEPAAWPSERAVPPSVPVMRPSDDDVDAHTEVTSRNDRLIRALLSGSAVAIQEDWADWIGAERAALASVWRHYVTYDTVLMRVTEGFPEAMLVDLATVTAPSAAALWEAFAEVSVGKLAEAAQVSASAIERLPDDTSLAFMGTTSLADTGGHETHAGSITRKVPSQTEFDRWKRGVWHALFMQLRAMSPVASTSAIVSISSVSFAALEAIALGRGSAAGARRALDLWRATVTSGTTDTNASPGTFARSLGMAGSMAADDHALRPLKSSIADAAFSATAVEPMSHRASTVAVQRLIEHRQRTNPQGGDLTARVASLSDAERVDLRQIVTEVASTRESDLVGMAAQHWQAVVDTMIAVSETIPDAHREVLYRSILESAPEVEDLPAEAARRYYASVVAVLASDAVLDLDLLAETAISEVVTSSPDDQDINSREMPTPPPVQEHRKSAERTGPHDPVGVGAPRHPDDQRKSLDSTDRLDRLDALPPFPPTSPSRLPAMPEDFIAYLTSTDFRQGRTPPSGFDIWLRQSVYSGAHVLRPVIATAAEDDALAERWLDLIPQPLWPGIARLSSRDTPQVAQMLRVASDITDLFATTVETVAPVSLHRARWRFLFPWLFMPQRPFDATTFATSLVAQLARHASVAVPPALAARVQQQTGIDMRTADVTDDAHLLQTPLMVPYAGMVLTWPFTAHLWDQLGLTKEHRFVSDEAAERAVLLLHYVGSGLTEAPEPHLTMHKLLCGLPFATPVARHFDITDDESTICDQMLDVIIQYWSALGHTSHAGLRGNFLQREGRFSLAEDGWHLKVRRAPYDMLLDRLPWSISTIRLSWMEQPLWVEWA
ncbi:contractile injection system tape measure protein [Pandoraea sp. NPDC090278]|uniref:contractile injection system tape measure protein n=1 Tax=Pandoraea sp. NPDC090278 TaxID=3364391 RepID=UPI00383A90AF